MAKTNFLRTKDVIYGRSYGLALTLDVFKPRLGANGRAVLWMASGGWYSGHEALNSEAMHGLFAPLLERGYTVVGVVHGSQPKFTIPEIALDIQRAVRFVRYNAVRYEIDPAAIGISGISSGGHLSLLQGMTGDDGNPEAADPIERISSRVQAVGCFCPPTDFLNYGKARNSIITEQVLEGVRPAFGFAPGDRKQWQVVARAISPITHVSPKSPPTLLIHGDEDSLVPIQQSQSLLAKLTAARVPARLITKRGYDHGWPTMDKDVIKIAEWYDKYLK